MNESVPLINATNVWQTLDNSGNNITGKGVSIAIIDTGVDYTHPDLAGCLGTGCKVVGGYDFVNNDNNPMDDHGHGTHVAATAAGNGTLKGVAPDATVYGYKVLSYGGWGYWSWVISGIQRATDPNNDGDYSDHVDIISMSLGGTGNEDDIVSQAVDTAVDRGVVVVSAAGNSGTATNAIGSPGAARKGIAVAASDKSDNIAYFSSRGPTPKNNIKPDITAPGVNICAAQWNSWLSTRKCYDDKHISISGTSMATPHVSGAAALLLQKNPTWSPSMVKSALMTTTIDRGNKLWDQGTGRMNVTKALSPLIVTFPQTISFGQISGQSISEKLTIQNLNSTAITFNVTSGLMKDSSGSTYNISYVTDSSTGNNITSIAIGGGVNATLNVTINVGTTEGTLYGYLNISYDKEVYRVPYAFTKLSRLTVNVSGSNNAFANPVFITVHNDSLTYTRYAIAWDITNGKYTFNLPSGNYIIHALGDYRNRTLTYILTSNITVPSGKEVQANLSLDAATKYNITALSINNTPLTLNKWQYMVEDVSGSRRWSASMTYLGYGETGDKIVYLSATSNESTKPNISFSFIGYPFRNNTYNENNYVWYDETFNSAEELYFLGYVLNGVSGSTQTIFNYTASDVGMFNYSYDYPGKDPRIGVTYPVDGFHGIYFWISPISWFDISSWHSFSIPLNRTAFIKGDNTWGYTNYMTYNYLTKNDLGGDWRNEFAAAAGQSEDDTKASTIWPIGVRVSAGNKRTLHYGKTPFVPTHFENTNSLVNLSSYILRGFTNETYMTKYSTVTWSSSDGTTGTILLPIPVISIYDSSNNLVYNSTTSWKVASRSLSAGVYTVNLTIPTGYPLSNRSIVTAKFDTSLSDKNPPFVASIIFPQRFEVNQALNFEFNVTDDVSVDNVTASYKTDVTDWTNIVLIRDGSKYNASLTITNTSANEINLKINTNDTSNNQANYTLLPLSILAHNISLNFTADKINVNQGDTIIFKGRVIDTTANTFLKGAKVIFLLGSSPAGYDRSELSANTWVYNSKRGWHVVNIGEFETIWEVPSNYPSGTATFTAVFNGTGIYKTNVTAISINVNGTAPKWSNLLVTPASPDANDNIQFNSTWTSANKVLFTSNYSGTSTEYLTNNTGNIYNYTIPANTLNANAVITYRFRANSSDNTFNESMTTRTLTIQEISANVTVGQTLLSANQNQNNTLYCDYVEVGASDITSATVKIEIDSSNNTATYNSTSGRYEYQYNATGSSGTKSWKCYGNKTNYQTKTGTSSFAIVAETNIPTYSNVVRTSDPIYTNTNVQLNSTWQNNVGLGLILLSSNYSGTWTNYTIVNNPSQPYTAAYTIGSGNFSSNQVVGWKYLANDSSNNWNNLMPIQTFTVQNRIPGLTFVSNDDNKGWGENWSFICNGNDPDSDTLTVYLWSKEPGGDWVQETSNTLASSGNTTFGPSQFFVPSYVGVSQVKCNVTDSKGGLNETSAVNITVEKDDVNISIVAGTNNTVQRYGINTIDLVIRVYDIDKSEYVNTPDAVINITKDGSTPYDVIQTCTGNSSGHCSFTLDPDILYSVGTQYFIGGTESSNSTYKSVNSSQSNFTIYGALFTSIDAPIGGFNNTQSVFMNTTVTDDTANTITADKVILEYRKSIGTAEWMSCNSVNESSGAKYYCAFNASEANLTVGFYDVRYTAQKANYTDSNITVNHQFFIFHIIVYRAVSNFSAFVRRTINATDMNSTIEVVSNVTLTNVEMNVTFNSSNFININFSVTELGKYIRINVSETLARNLSHALIKVNYTDEEINQSGVVESSLRLYKFNGTDWVAYNNQSISFNGGVVTDQNYVWGNVTSFSDYGVGGLKPNGQACSSNAECDSGNCAVDFDGEGKWCAAAGNCAHDYVVTYASGSSVCGDSSTRQTCSSGNWTSATCSAGCSGGVCSTSSVSVASGGGGSIVAVITTTTIPVKKEAEKETAPVTTTLPPEVSEIPITTTTLPSVSSQAPVVRWLAISLIGLLFIWFILSYFSFRTSIAGKGKLKRKSIEKKESYDKT